MISRELKHFHNENRTHVTKKEYAGAEISVGKTPVGKNLLPYPYYDTTKTINGVTFTDNGDGTIAASGTATRNAQLRLMNWTTFDKTKKYYISGSPSGGGWNTHGIYISFWLNGTWKKELLEKGNGLLLDLPNMTVEFNQIQIDCAVWNGATVENITFKPQLELGTTATGYEPFIRETYPVNAPMDLKIYGASEQTADYVMCEGGSKQTVTEQGKNLFDMDKKFDDVIPSLAHNTAAYQCDKTKVSKTEWRFYNFTKGGNGIAYFVMPFSTKKNTDYVLSLTVNGLGLRGYIGIDTRTTSNTTADQWNLAVKNWKDIITETETDIRISFSFNSRDYELLYFRGYLSQGVATDEGYCIFKEMQLEEGTTPTDYEAFVPDSPSADYPSEITPLTAAGTYKIGLDDGIYELTVPELFEAGVACDKLMLDKISKTAKAKREIDSGLLDPAKTIEENTQAVLETPVYETVSLTKVQSSSAPELPVKIYGKNLFNMESKFYDVIPGLVNTPAAYKCDKEKVSKTEWRFDNMAQASHKIAYFAVPLNVKKNTAYVLSLTVNRYKVNGPIGIANNVGPDTWNVVAGKNWSMYVPETETDTRIKFSFNSGNYELLYFRGYFSQGTATDESYCIFKNIQLEEGSTLTDYEAYNAAPPESLTPSADYPHKIYPSKEMTLKCAGGDTVNSTKIPLIGNAMEVSDIAQSNLVLDGKYYLSDYIEYNSATDKAYRHKFIDDTLLNTTLPIKDQTQAILAEPTVEEITAGEGEYSFKDAKSVQDGFTLTTESYSTDGLPHPKPMYIEAKIKVIKG